MMESAKIKEIQSKMESHPNPEVIIFSSRHDNEVGWLSKILKHFESNGVNLVHIESRCSSRIIGHYDFMVECWARSITEIDKAVEMVRADCDWLSIISRNVQSKDTVPWFPLKIRDLDKYSNQILSYGAELNSDHPGFTDPKYRERRKYFADIAYNYKHGQPLPVVTYTDDEIQTWSVIFKKLVLLYPTLACKEYNQVFPLLIENCGYRENNIPQLEDVSNFLKECTGFTLRPVAGLLSSRDFLAGLAFRVFHCTQYIRHPSKPFYTPEPDVCHELLGHAPLFADPSFAQFAQEIGLASLGAPDDYIVRLATCFWFTVEYGICIQDSQRKAYGAGLLSSYGELKYAIEDQTAEYKTFDPPETALQPYPITEYQPVYFVAESFEDAKDKMIKYASSIPRSFQVRYNAYTQSVEILNSKLKVENLIQTVNSEMQVLLDSLKKLNQSGGGANGNVISVSDSNL